MVQRKPDKKHVLQADAVDSEKKPSSEFQDVRNRGGDLTKKMKKGRSSKLSNTESMGRRKEPSRLRKPSLAVALAATSLKKPSPRRSSTGLSPNYMKPTSSSDAKKESLQVLPKTPITACKNRSHKCLSSSKSSASHTLINILKRSSSLKPIRPPMKKSPGITLYPKLNAGRATCSSTLKDSKFPAFVELNPGGTESEGTSIMKVCPYTYCSLNGHRHEPLPPLKKFISAKRRVLRTVSLKIKGALAPKMKISGEGKGNDIVEMEYDGDLIRDSDLAGSAITVLEEGDGDFFIQIYAKRKEDRTELGPDSGFVPSPEAPEEIMVLGDDDVACAFSECSEMDEDSWGDPRKIDQVIPVTLLDNLIQCDFSDYPLVTSESIENQEMLKEKINSEFRMGISLDGERPPCESDFEDRRTDWEQLCSPCPDDQETEPSEFAVDEESGLTTISFPENKVYEKDDETEDLFQSDNGTSSSKLDTGDSDSNCDVHLGDEEPDSEIEKASICAVETYIEDAAEKQEAEPQTNGEPKPDSCILNHANLPGISHSADLVIGCAAKPDEDDLIQNDSETNRGYIAEYQVLEEDTGAEDVANGNVGENFQTLDNWEDSEDNPVLEFEGLPEPVDEIRGKVSEEMDIAAEAGDLDAMIQDGNGKLTDHQSDAFVDEYIRGKQSDIRNTEGSECAENDQTVLTNVGMSLSSADERQTPASNEPNLSENLSGEEVDSLQRTEPNSKQSYNRKKRETVEDLDMVKQFNPRPPHFLPVELDPAAEKVDLRHQLMDERKNSEEWMLDYALRQTVNKLGSARKKRVALLVEAFEVVMPVPKFESHIRGPTSSFSHIRPIQACR